MKIYRLETRAGIGVYRVINHERLLENYSGGPGTRHPAPWRDSLFCDNHLKKLGTSADDIGFSGRYVFGFASPQQVLRWFFNREDLATLEKETGIQVSVYECEDVIEGNTQVAFGVWHHTLFVPVVRYGLVEFYDLFAGKPAEETSSSPSI